MTATKLRGSIAIVITLVLVLVPVLGMAATPQEDFKAKYDCVERLFSTGDGSTGKIDDIPDIDEKGVKVTFYAKNGFYQDLEDVTVYTATNNFVIRPSEGWDVFALCLGALRTDRNGDYLAGVSIGYTVNGVEQTYTTKATLAENALVIESADPIEEIVLLGVGEYIYQWNGLSYILVASEKPPTPIAGNPTPVSEGGEGGAGGVLEQGADEGMYEVTASRLNIRWGRGINFARVGQLKKGDVVKVLESKDGWGKIEFGMTCAYVSMEYLKKI